MQTSLDSCILRTVSGALRNVVSTNKGAPLGPLGHLHALHDADTCVHWVQIQSKPAAQRHCNKQMAAMMPGTHLKDLVVDVRI